MTAVVVALAGSPFMWLITALLVMACLCLRYDQQHHRGDR